MNHTPIRPDPDTLLAHIQSDEGAQRRGRLKIFLGYAAGVGKTYAMLEAAQQREQAGVGIVVGLVETHGRAETEQMLVGLEVIPRKIFPYRGTQLTELDTETLLARRPQLVLVDELAHTNAPGSLHARRYQDVEDLLAAGIDVYTTFNIQHLESLNDIIQQITGVTVRETVPDRILDEAHEIELVDLPPDELLQRFKEGKVYIPEQAALAIRQFFRKGNLTALREISMRQAARRVDDQMLAYMQLRAIPGPWAAADRILVCISPSTLSEKLVRSARRLADELKAEWHAVYVETGAHSRLKPAEQDRVAYALRLADDLGALSRTISGANVAETLIDYSKRNNITKIIAGKPLTPPWHSFLRGNIVDQIIQRSGDIDVYVISSSDKPTSSPQTTLSYRFRPVSNYLWVFVILALSTGLGALLQPFISPTNLVMVYLLAVVLTALYLGRGPAVMMSILGVLAFDFFFVPPFFTFAVSDTEYLVTFAGLLVVGLVISYLTVRTREQIEATRRREAENAALYSLSRDLAACESLEDVTGAILVNIKQTFGKEALLLLPREPDPNKLQLIGAGPTLQLTSNEFAVAAWVYEHNQPAGRGTETLSASQIRFIPLPAAQGAIGVLGILPSDPLRVLTPEQRRLLDTFASQAAQAIERIHLAEQAQKAQLLQETEKLQAALLASISHNLRTPLVTITGALTSLADPQANLDENARRTLAADAVFEADRLNWLVSNLLDMTRLEAGALHLNREAADLQDVVGAAIAQMRHRLDEHPVIAYFPASLPLVPLDFVLVVHVLLNLLDNAIKFSQPGEPVDIRAHQAGDFAILSISDHGVGIPEEDLNHIFEKFYRSRLTDSVPGTGLGLSISKGIIEAHGGKIRATNRPSGGTEIEISLPIRGGIEETHAAGQTAHIDR
jgi:two-component system, OmpR family, sensor histidine kinase KdpD